MERCNILLEENGTETGVESTDTLVLQDLAEPTDKTVGEGGLRDETDTGGFERAQSDVGKEFTKSGGSEVDGGTVVDGILITKQIDALLLEELVSTELEGALEEVTGGGGTETGPDGSGTLVSNDLPKATDEAAVVGYGVELDSRLDAATDVSLASKTCPRQQPLAPIEELQQRGIHTHRRE